ncbi:MAG: NrsF family protein [Polyangiaceae bacterium]
MSDLSFLDQIPDPIPEHQRPDQEREASKGKAETPAPQQPAPSPRFAETSADRAQTRRRRWVALALSGTWLVTHVIAYGVRQDLSSLPYAYVAVQLGLPVAVAVASLVVALRPGKLGLGVGLGAMVTLALLGPLSFWLAALGMPRPTAVTGNANLFVTLICFDLTLLWSALPLIAAAFSLRRSFASRAVWRSALIGATAGLFSGAAINLHCANGDPLHMAFGHGLPVVLGALVGAFVLARWLRA